MDSYLETIKTFLSENKPNYGAGNIDSLLGMLYWDYTERNPINSPQIKEDFRRLHSWFDGLSREEDDKIFSLILGLLEQHQFQAFREGMHVGLRMMTELTGDPKLFLDPQSDSML
ncbi:MAG: hypothetical protein IJ381_01960 [Clostridia bacterium]|nr:hypothetical protein [Clostridia bacterium]